MKINIKLSDIARSLETKPSKCICRKGSPYVARDCKAKEHKP